MKEHIQEINLIDSFFIRNKPKKRAKTAKPKKNDANIDMAKRGKFTKEQFEKEVDDFKEKTVQQSEPQKDNQEASKDKRNHNKVI